MLISLKELMSYKLQTNENVIGKIKDFLFDDKEWIVRYAVADTGNWLTDRLVLISPHALNKADWMEKKFETSLSKEQVEKSPKIDKDKPVSRQYETKMVHYYGWPVYWGGLGAEYYPAMHTMVETAEDETENEGVQKEKDDNYDPNLRSMNEVRNYRISAIDGELGHLEDMIVDEETWTLKYIVVDTSNFLPGSRKVLFAVVWIDNFDFKKAKVKVDLTKANIEASPEFNPAEPVNREYEERLYDFYGRPKYWH